MPQAKPINFLGIDAQTDCVKPILRALKRKKDIAAFESKGTYRECLEYTKIFIDTTMTEEELDTWFCGLADDNIQFAGFFTRKNYFKSEGYIFDVVEAVPLDITTYKDPADWVAMEITNGSTPS